MLRGSGLHPPATQHDSDKACVACPGGLQGGLLPKLMHYTRTEADLHSVPHVGALRHFLHALMA